MESIISFYRDTKYPLEISLMGTSYSRRPLCKELLKLIFIEIGFQWMWITKRLNWVLKDKIVVYKVTVPYGFVHYGYFMEGSKDIIRVLGYNLLIRPRVQLYLYSGLNIINGNSRLVKSWQKSPRPIGARVLLVPLGPISSHKLKPNWVGPKS